VGCFERDWFLDESTLAIGLDCVLVLPYGDGDLVAFLRAIVVKDSEDPRLPFEPGKEVSKEFVDFAGLLFSYLASCESNVHGVYS
jgi:hypothetical protein